MKKKEETKDSPLSQNFHWYHVDLQAYRLSWDTHNLTELVATQIALNVASADLSGNPINKTAEFEEGGITLEKLHPDKLYTVNLEALIDKVCVWSYVGMIETLPTGELVLINENTVLTHARMEAFLDLLHSLPLDRRIVGAHCHHLLIPF